MARNFHLIKQHLEENKTAFPSFKKHFDRCFFSIKKEFYLSFSQEDESDDAVTEKKNEIKQKLERSLMDWRSEHLTNEQIFQEQVFESVDTFINFLERLKREIDVSQKRIIILSERFGACLSNAKDLLDDTEYNRIEEACVY